MKTKIVLSSLSLLGILCACSEQEFTKLKSFNRIYVETEITIEPDETVEEITVVPVVQPVSIDNTPRDCGPRNIPRHEDPTSIIIEEPCIIEKPIIDFEKLYDDHGASSQTQSITNNRDVSITFDQGTKLHIKANSFVLENGRVPKSEVIDVSVSEYYELSDILSSNLNTETKDGILETGGTIYIGATSDGKKCKLRYDASIDIEFPTDQKLANMDLFQGDRIGDRIIWRSDEESIGAIKIVEFPDVEAQFPGGTENLMRYISRNIYYPSEAIENNEQGSVMLSFDVKRDGSLDSIKVLRSVSESLDECAIWAIERMPKWTPATLNGENVRSRVRLPIVFKLEGAGAQNVYSATPTKAELKEAFEKKMLRKGGTRVSIQEASSYMLSSANLGWINCDRFYKYEGPKTDVLISTESNEKANIKIVFDNRRVVLQGIMAGNAYQFKNIPIDEPVTVVAFKILKNECYFAVKKTRVESSGVGSLKYEKCTLDEMKTAMAGMGW